MNKVKKLKIKARGSYLFKKIKSKTDVLDVMFRGKKTYVHPCDWQFWLEAEENAWEPFTIKTMEDHISVDTKFCDIGAWVGPTTILATQLGAKVTCFEPDPAAYERLLFNLRSNQITSARAFQVALSGMNGVIRMAPMSGKLGQCTTSIHSQKRQVAGTNATEVISLTWQTAEKMLELDDYNFFKIDIEGGESELLPGMMEFIGKTKPSILLSTHAPFIPKDKLGSFMLTLIKLSDLYKTDISDKLAVIENGFATLFFSGKVIQSN